MTERPRLIIKGSFRLYTEDGWLRLKARRKNIPLVQVTREAHYCGDFNDCFVEHLDLSLEDGWIEMHWFGKGWYRIAPTQCRTWEGISLATGGKM